MNASKSPSLSVIAYAITISVSTLGSLTLSRTIMRYFTKSSYWPTCRHQNVCMCGQECEHGETLLAQPVQKAVRVPSAGTCLEMRRRCVDQFVQALAV